MAHIPAPIQCLIVLAPLAIFLAAICVAAYRGARSIRALALAWTLASCGTFSILYLGAGDLSLLLLGIGGSVIVGLAILSWPITAPKTVRRLGLRW